MIKRKTISALRIYSPLLLFLCVPCFSLANDAVLPALLDLKACTKTDGNGTTIIHIPAGIYKVTRTISLASRSILEGEGNLTVLQAEDPFTGPRFITNADFAKGNRDITVRNMKIEFMLPVLVGDDIGIIRFENVEHLKIKNLTIAADSQLYSIDLSARIRDAAVEGCSISNRNRTSGGGVMIRNKDPRLARATSDIVVRNNMIESVSDEPIATFGWEGRVENILVEKNTIQAQGASFGITVYGIDSRVNKGSIRNVRVAGNFVSGSMVGGIAVKGGAQTVEVVDNVIKGVHGDGVFLHTGGNGLPDVQDIRIMRNSIADAGRHCIFASGVKINVEKNVIHGCSQIGIYAAGDVTVLDNDIAGAKPGILVDGGRRKNIRGNVLHQGARILFQNRDGSVSTDEASH